MKFDKRTGPKPHWLLLRKASEVAQSEQEQLIVSMAMRANGVSTEELKALFGRQQTSRLLDIQQRPHVHAIALSETRVKLYVE